MTRRAVGALAGAVSVTVAVTVTGTGPPGLVVATVTVAGPLCRLEVAYISDTFVLASAPPNVTVYETPGVPVTATSPTAIFDNPSSASWTEPSPILGAL